MPLHDWSRLPEWEGVHQLWISELYYDIRSKLPPGYRAGLAKVPGLTIGAPPTHPDINVREVRPATPIAEGPSVEMFPSDETVAVMTLDPNMVIHIRRANDLVAVFELISPRNKDREETRKTTVDRVIGYLMLGVHVAYVDVHAQPLDFSLADAVAFALKIQQPRVHGPQAMAYAVGGPLEEGGRDLSIRRLPLAVGQPLPTLYLPLTNDRAIALDLETTYAKVTDSYLSWLPTANGTE